MDSIMKYKKPVLIKVNLKMKETALGGCKLVGSGTGYAAVSGCQFWSPSGRKLKACRDTTS